MARMQQSDLQPLLDVQQNQLNVLLTVSGSIDNKALAILASNVAILLFVAGVFNHLPLWQWVVLLSPFVVSLWHVALAVWPREYRGAGVSLAQHPEYLALSAVDLLLQLLADTQTAVAVNTQLNAVRLRYCGISLISACFGVLVLCTLLGVY